MCPICWATALASFGILTGLSIVSVAGTDLWTLTFAVLLLTASLAERSAMLAVPWWCLAVLIGVVVTRVAFLLAFQRKHLLLTKAWSRACQIAARRCPKREL